jgi:hypothetical protein
VRGRGKGKRQRQDAGAPGETRSRKSAVPRAVSALPRAVAAIALTAAVVSWARGGGTASATGTVRYEIKLPGGSLLLRDIYEVEISAGASVRKRARPSDVNA